MSVYGAALMLLYLASTLYHGAPEGTRKNLLRRFDYSAIYLLIAGTYTPFAVMVLPRPTAAWILAVQWGLALVGIVLSLFFRQYKKTWPQIVAVTVYLVMGWLVLPVIREVISLLGPEGFRWLLAGGIFYTAGVVFFALRRVRYAHALWHLFVLAGSLSHFVVVYSYL